MTTVPTVRQLVLLVPDLDDAVAEVRQAFDFPAGIRVPEEMGFSHELFAFGDTFLELSCPTRPDSPAGKSVAANGPSGYMVDVQVADLNGVIERAKEKGIEPLVVADFQGNRISQWHPRSLGTLAEFDEIDPVDSWHFADRVFELRTTTAAQDIVAAHIAVDDPGSMAVTWSEIVGVSPSGTTVHLSATRLEFVQSTDRRGLVAFEVVATDPARIGETIDVCGVTVHFVRGEAHDIHKVR